MISEIHRKEVKRTRQKAEKTTSPFMKRGKEMTLRKKKPDKNI